MKKIVLFFLFIAPVLNGFGQYLLPAYTAMPDKIPAEFLKQYADELRYAKSKADYSAIPDSAARELLYKNLAVAGTGALTEGEIFYTWPEATKYLTSILEMLTRHLPEDVKRQLRIYPGYSGGLNASCYHNGTIIFDMGSFNYLKNEAQVAALIAHEISHFILTHSYKGLENKYNNFNKLPRLYQMLDHKPKRSRIEVGQFSQKQELQADSLGMELYVGAGYDPNEYLETEKIFIALEKSYEKYRGYEKPTKKSMLFSTHPATELRLQKLTELGARFESKGEKFLLDAEDFTHIASQAVYGTIAVLYKRGEYYLLTEFCFAHYLYEPTNKVYVYYLLEGIRKLCYANHSTWDNAFLTDRYKDWKNIVKFINRENPGKVIADGELVEKSNQVSQYWKAFRYFSEKAEALNIGESYLTMALAYYDRGDEKTYRLYLNKYLQTEQPLYREYAAFIGNYIPKDPSMNEGTLVILGDLSYIDYDGKTTILKDFDLYTSYLNDSIEQKFESAFAKARKKVTFYNSYRHQDENLNQYFDQFIYSYVAYTKIATKAQKSLKKEVKPEIPPMMYFDPKIYDYYIKGHAYQNVYILDYNIECKNMKKQKRMAMNCDYEFALLHLDFFRNRTSYALNKQYFTNVDAILQNMLILTGVR